MWQAGTPQLAQGLYYINLIPCISMLHSVAVSMPLPPIAVESKRRSSINKLKNYVWLEIFGAQEFYEKEEVSTS